MPRSISPSSRCFSAMERAKLGKSVRVSSHSPDRPGQLGLLQIEVPGLAHLQVPGARDHRVGLDQVDRVQQPPAVVALIAPRPGIGAVRTGSLDVAVGEEAAVIDRIDQLVGPLLDETVVLQHVGEVLGQPRVLGRRRAAEPVPRQAIAAADVVLQLVLLLAVGEHVLVGGGGRQLGRRAVLVGGADVERLVALRALEAGVDIGRQQRAGEVAEMLDPVDVRQGRGDEDTGHLGGPLDDWTPFVPLRMLRSWLEGRDEGRRETVGAAGRPDKAA